MAASISEEQINNFIIEQQNKNTSIKTKRDVRYIQRYLLSLGETRNVELIPPNELDVLISTFLINVKKLDGSEYEPTSLRAYISSLDRHLKVAGYSGSVIGGLEFGKTRQVLGAKLKQLKSLGKGNRPNAAQAITDEQIELLWENEQLGFHNPEAILNTMWLYSTICFGLRGFHEHRQMSFGDLTLERDQDEIEYLVFNERQSKTRQGGDTSDIRKVSPRMWANSTNPLRCPVEVYKFYCKKRPTGYSKPNDPFYVATSTKPADTFKPDSDSWFKKQPVGENKLRTVMKRMALSIPGENFGLKNHSARKHMIQKLIDHDVPPTEIVQISGHKNISSINNYSSINLNKQKHISSILTCTNKKKTDSSQAQVLTQHRHEAKRMKLSNQTQTQANKKTATSTVTRATATITTASQKQINFKNTNTLSDDELAQIDDPSFDLGYDISAPNDPESTVSQPKSTTAALSTISSLFSGPIYGGVFNIHINK